MRRLLACVLTVAVVLAVLMAAPSSTIGCASPDSAGVGEFLRDDDTVDVLWEHDDLMADANHVFHISKLRGDACTTLARAADSRERILDTRPPQQLLKFWVQVMVSAEFVYSSLEEFCNRGWTYMVIDDWNSALESRENAYSILDEVLAEQGIDPESAFAD